MQKRFKINYCLVTKIMLNKSFTFNNKTKVVFWPIMDNMDNKEDIILGVDVGTTGVKVIAANSRGEAFWFSEETYEIIEPQPGYREQDPDLLFDNLQNAIRQVVSACTKPIVGVSFSTAMHSILAVDTKGLPLSRAIIWADIRSTSYAQKLRDNLGKDIYYQTGAPIHAMLPLCKIAWLRDHEPAMFRHAHKFISLKEYFFFKWFGTYLIDHSIASATGFFHNELRTWIPEALGFAGITEDKLSKPVPTTFVVKGLSKASATALGLPPDTPFVIGASDGCLANLNASGLSNREATLTLGTSGAIRVSDRGFHPDPNMRVFSYLLTDEYRVMGGPTNNGGIILEWLLEKLFPDLSSPDEVMQKAAQVPAGAEGLVCVPYIYGERAPAWLESEVGTFHNIQSHHSRDHFARAALEGIIFNLFSIGKGLQSDAQRNAPGTSASSPNPSRERLEPRRDAAQPLEAIWADGGLTRSSWLVQVIADVFNLPVYLSDGSHGVARGAVLLGAYALGLVESLDAHATDHKKKVFKPDQERHQLYQQNYAVFEKLRSYL